ncbi:MAG: hypothetical protein LAN62_04030 [Acidobacteriia bacterium]|nr:hypothetical protein [Terriglobia bacterium]
MAFIRKRGGAYYLVHSVRKKGRVRQLYLARLGPRPRISEEVIRGVRTQHPFLHVKWDELKAKAARDLVQPLANNSQYLRDLLSSVRNLHMDIADLHLPVLGMTHDPDLTAELTTGLKLLRTTLDVKLAQLRKGGYPALRS